MTALGLGIRLVPDRLRSVNCCLGVTSLTLHRVLSDAVPVSAHGLCTTSPTLTITSPQDSLLTNRNTVTVAGTAIDSTQVTVAVDGNSVPLTNGAFSTTWVLSEGENAITVIATNAAGNATTITKTVRMYAIPPAVTISSPSDSLLTNQNVVHVSGTVSDSTAVTLTINGSSVPVTNGSFSTTCLLVEGMNTIIISAADAAGNKTTATGSIRLYAVPPTLTITSPNNGTITNQSSINITGAVQTPWQ